MWMGATFQDLGRAGIGAVLRDSSGKVILAMSKTEICVEESEVIELLAILRGLQLCVNMGIPYLMVESDSKLVIEALHTDNMIHSSLGGLYREAKLLATRFVHCKFSHIYREAGVVWAMRWYGPVALGGGFRGALVGALMRSERAKVSAVGLGRRAFLAGFL
ncbi:unnamed protein product [Fraxinus pennsylvanica]|uniref:RNase H type-1 domain-containing protein n=1 Tax=Fraxinus pennsylvanica TaxID=56036 RepID=A0AAD2DG53_9LAMI|nr:unnamed protein product [Fraxinus pennsylvanica]